MPRFKLYYTPTSPFVRKVLVAAHELGLADDIETLRIRPAPATNEPTLSHDNPLAKIPALLEEGHAPLFDSPVICEYLDSLHAGPRLIPAAGAARWRVLRTQALSDGILDAAILVFYEKTQRPEERHWEPFLSQQSQKALQGLDALEREAGDFGKTLDLGQIAIACGLGWMEFRNALGDLRSTRPRLFAWYDEFRQRPSMVATEPHA